MIVDPHVVPDRCIRMDDYSVADAAVFTDSHVF
jgi:hypothetical protein